MKSTRTVALAGILLAATALAMQDGLLLRRELKADSVENYKIVTKVATVVELPSGMGEQEMNADISQTYSLKTGKIDPAKGAEVQATTTYESIKVSGMLGDSQEKIPAPNTVKGHLDRYGRLAFVLPKVKNVAEAAMDGTMVNSILNPFIEFPNESVKVGGTWQIPIQKSMVIKTPQSLTATLVGEEQVDGRAVLKVAVAGTVALDMGTFTLPKTLPNGQGNPLAGQKMSVTAELDIKADGLVDKATGQTLKLKSTTKSKQKMSVVDLGMVINSTSDVGMDVALVK